MCHKYYRRGHGGAGPVGGPVAGMPKNSGFYLGDRLACVVPARAVVLVDKTVREVSVQEPFKKVRRRNRGRARKREIARKTAPRNRHRPPMVRRPVIQAMRTVYDRMPLYLEHRDWLRGARGGLGWVEKARQELLHRTRKEVLVNCLRLIMSSPRYTVAYTDRFQLTKYPRSVHGGHVIRYAGQDALEWEREERDGRDRLLDVMLAGFGL